LLLPAEPVRNLWNIAYADPAAYEASAFSHYEQLSRHEIAERRYDEYRIRGSCGILAQTAGPDAAERADASMGRDITEVGEGQDAPPLPGADPGDDLSRRSKVEDANPVAGARRYERTLADQASAKKGARATGPLSSSSLMV
jgi:hypothetical protein